MTGISIAAMGARFTNRSHLSFFATYAKIVSGNHLLVFHIAIYGGYLGEIASFFESFAIIFLLVAPLRHCKMGECVVKYLGDFYWHGCRIPCFAGTHVILRREMNGKSGSSAVQRTGDCPAGSIRVLWRKAWALILALVIGFGDCDSRGNC